MPVDDQFGVANLVGHPAFDQLALATKVYDQAQEANLLDPASHSWQECLVVGGKLRMLRQVELRHCVQAVVLFQAMMEKIPYFVPTIGTGIVPTTKRAFAPSWKDLISRIKDDDGQKEAAAAFDSYDAGFYKAFRNPIIHGKSAGDVEKVNAIRVPGVHEGMLRGWRAYDYLLTEAFAPEQTHEPSWEVICQAHELAAMLDLSNFPDLDDMQAQFFRKHLSGARAAVD